MSSYNTFTMTQAYHIKGPMSGLSFSPLTPMYMYVYMYTRLSLVPRLPSARAGDEATQGFCLNLNNIIDIQKGI